jgi:hypothetical protein
MFDVVKYCFPPFRATVFPPDFSPSRHKTRVEFNFHKVSRQDEGPNSIQLFKSFPPRRGLEFNFSKVSRQDEGSNSTFQKFKYIRMLKDVELLLVGT